MREKSDVTFEQWGDARRKDWEIIDLEAFEKKIRYYLWILDGNDWLFSKWLKTIFSP